MDEAVLKALLDDIETAPIDAKLKPILRYVHNLTTILFVSRVPTPKLCSRLAGWEDKAFHDAISVCALFNFMNRLVEGIGITAETDYFRLSGERLHNGGYAGQLKLLDQ